MFKPVMLLEDELNLVMRKQSKYIYARYKHPKTGVWEFKGTRKLNIKEASAFALKWYYGYMERVKQGLPTATRTMNKIIDMYLERIEEAYKHGDITKSNYDVKRRVTAKWVRPHFGNKLLHTLNRGLMEFADWRRNYFRNQPEGATIDYMRKNGTIGHRPIQPREREARIDMVEERAILNSLFRIAANKGWIKERDIPRVTFRDDVVIKGRTESKVKKDVFFTPEEIKSIKYEMQDWSNNEEKFRYRHQAAYYYVMLCFTTGVRPGTAMDSVRWRDVQAIHTGGSRDVTTQIIDGLEFVEAEDGDPIGSVRLEIYVPSSKVGSYVAIGLNEGFCFFNDWKAVWMMMAQDLEAANKRRAYNERRPVHFTPNDDDLIFLLPNGYHLKGPIVSRYFTKYLTAVNRLTAEGSQDNRTLYSTRHSFISHMQAEGVPDPLIAAFTGTSREMFDKHYGHAKVKQSGKLFPDFNPRKLK